MEEFINDEDLQEEFETELQLDVLNGKKTNEFKNANQEKDVPELHHLEVLSKCFGHKAFRPIQWKIIWSIIFERRDNCAILATGYGKSLCYQYPSAFMGGVTLVISPLISLMEDQVLAMEITNIQACLLGTANTQQKRTIEEIFDKRYQLIYLTPEFCTGDYGLELLQKIYAKIPITLIAVDEAHCISSWGHDFRFQYRNLSVLKKIMPDVPILAVTATATPRVQKDVIRLLNLQSPQISCSGFDRPNLYFSVHLRSSDILGDFYKLMDYENGKKKFLGSTIIYCITRKQTETVCEILNGIGIQCLPYHAGISLKMRKEAHEKFIRDKLNIIVATIAFGMGINKPDVRNVIHYGSSNSIEGYYQEAGRAGRDGLPAKCTVFYSNNDFNIHRALSLKNISNSRSEEKHEMLETMMKYLTTRECRRQFILDYFENGASTYSQKNPHCCDNCTRKQVQPDSETYEGLDKEGRYDFTEDARTFLRAVNTLNGKYGIQMYVYFLQGSRNSKMSNYVKHPLHGSGKEKSEVWWKGIGALLLNEHFLQKKTMKKEKFTYATVHVSSAGANYLKNDMKLIKTPTPELFSCLKIRKTSWLSTEAKYVKPNTSMESNMSTEIKEFDKKLYNLLLNKRYQLACAQNYIPYMVASNKALMDMARYKPVSLEQLRTCQLESFTENKIAKFGEEFLKIVRTTVNLEDSVEQSRNVKKSIQDVLISHPLTVGKIGMAVQATYSFFKSGLSREDIAKRRGVTVETITSNLLDAMTLGYPIKMSDFGVTGNMRRTITEAISTVSTGLSLITPIKNACPPYVTFTHVKAVVNYIKIRSHLKSLDVPYEEFEDFDYNDTILCNSQKDLANIKGSCNQSQEDEAETREGKLTQLLRVIDDFNTSVADKKSTTRDLDSNFSQSSSDHRCNELNTDFSKNYEEATSINLDSDSYFSEDVSDADLAAICDKLDTDMSKKHCELTVTTLESCDEPAEKRSKTDDSSDFGFSILDSPPRMCQFSTNTKIVEKETNQDNIQKDGKVTSNLLKKSNSRASKKTPNLPPWLTTKKKM